MEIAARTDQSALDHKLVGSLRGMFFIPRYQRGYRWDTDDVRRLLDDIWDSKGKDYSLQPIVVKCRRKDADEANCEWELIDGQQRLTTLFLIFHYMQKEGWRKMGAPYSISYQTRPDSEDFLGELDLSEEREEKSKQNIDYFHMYQAFRSIDGWFQVHGDAYKQESVARDFQTYLDKNVKIIWYEAPISDQDDEKDSTALFTRLNVGRIPLTDAELVKAQLLSTVRQKKAERTQEVAAQWDGIEIDLHEPEIWAFVTGPEKSGGNEYTTRINLLLDTIADENAPLKGKRPRYHTFDALRDEIEVEPIDFWEKVVNLHALIIGWYCMPHLYNMIGALVAVGTPFYDLVSLAKGMRKKEFENKLDEQIRDKIGVSETELDKLRYGINDTKIANILLLMNIATVSKTGQRFPFHRHVGKKWSLEHIHAQNSESLTEKKQWKDWLEQHMNALKVFSTNQGEHEALIKDIQAALQKIDTDRSFGQTFQNLASQIINVFSDDSKIELEFNHDMHSISNLALLSIDDNSALNNSVFEVKRQKILEIDRQGDYIPICTRNVFLKYYTGADAQQIHFWSPQDKECYFKAIVSLLKYSSKDTSYLKAEEMNNES
jgi:hypothetical protein